MRDEVSDYPEDLKDKSERPARVDYGDISPLRIIAIIFVVVVGLAVIVSSLMPGAFNAPWKMGPGDGVSTVKARVDRILSETPLIGPPALFAPLSSASEL